MTTANVPHEASYISTRGFVISLRDLGNYFSLVK